MKKNNKNTITGCKGEKIAAEYLTGKGYIVIETNWRFIHKEIDIIAYDNNILVFVEVKTRKPETGLTYEDVLTIKKQQNMMEAAEQYIQQKNIEPELRFDLIFITLQDESFKLEHLPNAFNAEI